MATIKITSDNFENEVLNSDKTVLIDFYADWCGPCRMLAPTLEKIANENPDIKVCKVNADDEEELTASFGVMSIPALFVLKDGKVVNQGVGAMPEAQILAMLK